MPLTITDAGIDVTITRQTRSPTQQEFGTALFVATRADVGPTRIRKYTSMSAVTADYDAADEPYKAALSYYSQIPKPINFWVGEINKELVNPEVGSPIAAQDALDSLAAIDPGFFGVMLSVEHRDSSYAEDAAAWCQANDKVLFYSSNNADCKNGANTTNIMYLLKQAGYSNSCGLYSSAADEYPEVAAFGVLATTSYRGKNTVKTLKFKDLVGITPENLSPTDLAGIKTNNGNVFYEVSGIRMMDDGRTASTNTWIDTIIATYALAEEIRVRVFGKLARVSTKVPYTEPGMEELKAEVEGGLLQFKDNGFLADSLDTNGDVVPAYGVSSLPVSGASQADKSARIAPDIQFWAREAGAWHEGKISGTLVL